MAAASFDGVLVTVCACSLGVAIWTDRVAGLKYKAALSVAYGAGLRAAEVVALKVSDIDSKRSGGRARRAWQPQRRGDRRGAHQNMRGQLPRLVSKGWPATHGHGHLVAGGRELKAPVR